MEGLKGLHDLVDWDREAMADIEGIRTCGDMGGINRDPESFWRVHSYDEVEGRSPFNRVNSTRQGKIDE